MHSYRYWILNPDQATTDTQKCPQEPIITAKLFKKKTTINDVRGGVSMRTEADGVREELRPFTVGNDTV
jgi:hypothetical protein